MSQTVPADDYIEGDHPTDNPDGVTNSNVDYTPKTQEEKAAMLNVEMVDPVDVERDEPYPTTEGADPESGFFATHGFRRDGKPVPDTDNPATRHEPPELPTEAMPQAADEVKYQGVAPQPQPPAEEVS